MGYGYRQVSLLPHFHQRRFHLDMLSFFYLKTPYSIHSLPSENFSENKPEGYILQFEFENKHPTRKLIEETTKIIRNHEYLSNNCVHGESLKSGIPPELSKVIPNHSCLIFSPANLPDSDHEFPRNIEQLFKGKF
ncbi:Oidioi.mRNA.OKI2018_I69.chr2.g7457.t1.cds [Oikopleura dioica]|uniref:Oidioi.mRNA.OKI2018_I69.chr2.g7457.t1.cds n=1 Tax=Oikopleura dioica TaxID=34765 RepID=A0ABN7T690_OIKDI|nr:Oidioi.mRNA.OKI2018_I69.chr2.g7457.t1.cds [Oikopleura dioica]